jgi:succinate dehydrogenase hydrophobic anchor subunit
MFLFTRVSGACIILLAVIGLVSAFMLGARTQMDVGTLMCWTFFPNSFHVVNYVPDIQVGWANGFWQIMQMLIVIFGVTHGFNGLRVVLEDYLKGDVLRLALRTILFLLWLFMLIAAFELIKAS